MRNNLCPDCKKEKKFVYCSLNPASSEWFCLSCNKSEKASDTDVGVFMNEIARGVHNHKMVKRNIQ